MSVNSNYNKYEIGEEKSNSFEEEEEEEEYIYIKSPLKFLILILLYSHKIIYPEIKTEFLEEDIKNIFPKYYDKYNEIKYAEEYFDLCNNGTLIGNQRFKRNKNPKFSIIIPVYNKEMYITRVLRSIQNQSYKNIEIIIVDDFSTDDSVNIIKDHQTKDKRIKLIRHSKNQGTLITRNDGALKARGEYITFVDPDDILYEGILKKLAGAIEIYGSEVIRFDAFYRTEEFVEKYDYGNYFKRNTVITQPEIFYQCFYRGGSLLYQQNLFLWGKIIKRELFLEVIDNLTEYYKRQHWTLYEDNAMDFILLKYAKTYTFIEENGYIYCYSSISSYSNRKSSYKANRTVKDVFLLAEICFDYTNNNEYEKEMATVQLRRFIDEYKDSLEKITEGFEFYYRILNKFEKCKYINPQSQKYIRLIKAIIKNSEQNINSNTTQTT